MGSGGCRSTAAQFGPSKSTKRSGDGASKSGSLSLSIRAKRQPSIEGTEWHSDARTWTSTTWRSPASRGSTRKTELDRMAAMLSRLAGRVYQVREENITYGQFKSEVDADADPDSDPDLDEERPQPSAGGCGARAGAGCRPLRPPADARSAFAPCRNRFTCWKRSPSHAHVSMKRHNTS